MRQTKKTSIADTRTAHFAVLDKGKPVVRRGRKAMGSYPSEGGRFKAARLPKGWTGPVSMSGCPGVRKDTRIFFCASTLTQLERTGEHSIHPIDHLNPGDVQEVDHGFPRLPAMSRQHK